MNLLNIYSILDHIEEETKGTVEAKLQSGELVITVHWFQHDFNYRRVYTAEELETALHPSALIEFFTSKAKRTLQHHLEVKEHKRKYGYDV